MVTLNREVIKQVFASVDWGFTNPGVLQVWAVDGDRRMYRVHEVYQTHRTIDWWIERAKEAQRHFGIGLFVADPSEPAYIEQFNKAGLRTIGGFNEVGPGIQAVAQRFRVQEDGRPRLVLLRDALEERDTDLVERKKPCCMEEEIEGYIWNLTGGRKNGEEPVKQDDHAMDAARYAAAYLDGLDDEKKNPLRGNFAMAGVKGWNPR